MPAAHALLALLCCLPLSLAPSAVHAQNARTDSALTTVQAAPEPAGGDAVLHLLQQRGILPKPATGDENKPLSQQVRDVASDLVLSAMNFLGIPYRRGGNSAEEGFDCSGFTRHIFENSIGLVLPRRSDQQAQDGSLTQVRREELKPGDLVFFNTMRRAFSHVGIYVGEGRFIHAPRAGGAVRIEDMRQAYWSQRFNGARRPDIPAAGALNTTQPHPNAPALSNFPAVSVSLPHSEASRRP